ncbi:MAG: (2Fe-2S)-binding protein, partial [Leptospiraceae bacterium]|nr:(2Fe-2S)-binding protein [Leptospiraceae bacterium]
MPCIVYQDEERAVLVSKGSTILQASLGNKIPHYSECGGKGTCTTCKVKILSGHENLMTRNHLEMEVAKTRNWDKTIRLACQSRILGDVVIEKLVKTEEDSFNTYLEAYY